MAALRPPALRFQSLAELYKQYEDIFLHGNEVSHQFISDCGLTITVFDHNFFHIVKLTHPDRPKLFMKDEKALLRAQTEGFGVYGYDPQRGMHLHTARETLEHPDEVYEDARLTTASHVFIKCYEEAPYPFTVVLVAARDGNLLVPTTSFPCRRRDVKRWQRGKLIYRRPKNTTAAG